MTSKHGGWEDDEIASVTGSGPSQEPVRERMNRFADGLPEDAANLGAETPAADASIPTGAAEPQVAEAIPEGKRVKATPKKLKKLISSLPETLFKKNGIVMDEEDKESVEEAVEFLEDIFGFEFQVSATKYTVQSRIWALLWPLSVILFVVIKHKFSEVLDITTWTAKTNGEQSNSGDSRTEGKR